MRLLQIELALTQDFSSACSQEEKRAKLIQYQITEEVEESKENVAVDESGDGSSKKRARATDFLES